MKPPEPEVIIDFKTFNLPFTQVDTEDSPEEDEDVEYDRDEDLDEKQALIPSNAIELGILRDVVENFTTWETEDYFYLIPWPEDGFDWALFRISWDDNWGRFDWLAEARIGGVRDSREAARKGIEALFGQWKIDLSDEERSEFREYLDQL